MRARDWHCQGSQRKSVHPGRSGGCSGRGAGRGSESRRGDRDEKLAWVRQELEENADIEAFCKTFLDIFADKFTTAVAQKKTALRLWCVHNGREVITASINLPADELELFELAWNAEALARCRGCKGEVAGVPAGFHAHDDPYCCENCRIPAGMQVVCWKCKKPATMVGDWHHCETCYPPPLKKRNIN